MRTPSTADQVPSTSRSTTAPWRRARGGRILRPTDPKGQACSGRRWSSACCLAAALLSLSCGEDEVIVWPSALHDAAAPEPDAGPFAPGPSRADAGGMSPETPRNEPPPGATDDDFDVGDSRTLAALQDEEVVDSLCNAVGLAALNANASVRACEAAVEQCRQAARAPDADGVPESTVLPQDLAASFGCSVTTTEIDACLADLILIAADSLSEVTCEAPQIDPLGPSQLLGALSCAPVFLKCPELAEPLLAAVLGTG